MKTIKKILGSLLACATILPLLYSCTEEVEYTPADPDVDGCFGVYFSSQAVSLTLNPDDELVDTLTVYRTNTEGAITVPYEFTNETGVFVIENDIVFADGLDSTLVVVSFENAEMGTTYTCSIAITDPQYASYYNSGAPEVQLSILRDKWNDLGNCLYTDDFFTTFYGVDNPTWEVPVQESDLNPGLYRLEYPYDEKYPYNDPGDWDTSKTYYFVVNATDPDCVYIEQQEIGVDWGYGMISVMSYGYYYYLNDYSWDEIKAAGHGGTLKNGYITFADSDLLINMPDYSSGWYYANTNGAFKIALPGAADFSFTIEAGESSNGEVPLSFDLSEDIDHVRYQIYEGSLKDSEVSAYADEIAADDTLGVDAVNSHLLESESIAVDLGTTGIYTIVAVSFDENNEAQESTSLQFCYLAADDSMPVTVGAEMSATSRYIGYSSDNTLEFSIYGSDITDAKYDIVRSSDYEGDPTGIQENVRNKDSVGSNALSSINDLGGYSAWSDGYVAGTEYTLVVWASNGYESTFVTATAKTTGHFDATIESLLGTYTVTETSYYGSYYDDVETWVFEESDNPSKGNIMLTWFDGWPCRDGYIYGTLDLDDLTFSFYGWQNFMLNYSGYDLWFSSVYYYYATFDLIGEGQFTGADDIFGVYMCDSDYTEEDDDYYIGYNNAYTYVSGKRVSESEDSVKPTSIRNLAPLGKKSDIVKVDKYARFRTSDEGREVKTATYSVREVSAPATVTSAKTFSKGSAPKKSAKKVDFLK